MIVLVASLVRALVVIRNAVPRYGACITNVIAAECKSGQMLSGLTTSSEDIYH